MRIIDVPIEPIPMRYSEQWGRWFEKEFHGHKVPAVRINVEPMSEEIKQGRFLDICGTHYYKAKQLGQISYLMEGGFFTDDDVFFFHDLWFPGIEMLFYMRDALDMKFKITGVLHAGSWDPQDMISHKEMNRWAWHLESAILKEVDAVFVATHFHRLLIRNYFGDGHEFLKKIHVTGLPIYPNEFARPDCKKQNIIVFPHRWNDEKQPKVWLEFKERLIDTYTIIRDQWKFIDTFTLKTKEEYYNVLNTAKISVSFALQETWGIAMQESVLCGCLPVVPDRLSYEEMYPWWAKYVDDEVPISINRAIETVLMFINPKEETGFDAEEELGKLQRKFNIDGSLAIPKMISIMTTL